MERRRKPSEQPGFRYLAVAEMLERDIEGGRYAIGDKLPSERALAKLLDASHLTVRQGIDILVRKGLVRRELGSGTYVTATHSDPIIGILFGPSLVDESAHFYRALLGALEAELLDTPYTCRSYDGFNRFSADETERSVPYQQLLRDARNHPFEGLIQISLTDPRWNSLQPLKNVPKATHGETNRDIIIDCWNFGKQTFEFALGNRCKDILYLRTLTTSSRDLLGMEEAARLHRVPLPEIVQIDGMQENIDVLAHDKICELAMTWSNRGKHPDALIVSDDIATRGVAIALIKAGIQVPADMQLVTLANEGICHHYGLDAVRFAFSTSELAGKLISVLMSRIDGKMEIPSDVITGDWALAKPSSKAGTPGVNLTWKP